MPGDVAELRATCGEVPGLQTISRNGYLGIECGYQAALLGRGGVNVAPAEHVPWAMPYARGPIKLLIICSVGNAPTDVEQLAQVTRALDSQVRWLLVAEAAVTRPDVSDPLYRTQYLPAQAREALRENYDAILISFGTLTPGKGVARAHGYFPDAIYQTILDKVQRGTGLVITGQYAGGFWVDATPLRAALPAQWRPSQRPLEPLKPAPDSAVFADLDMPTRLAPPSTDALLYDWDLRPDAQVLARSGERPAIMTRKHGQGQIVLLGWDGTLAPERGDLPLSLREGDMAVALRAITFAARKAPQAQLHVPEPTLPAGGAATLQLRASRAAALQWTLRDQSHRPLSGATQALRAGDNSLVLPAVPAGQYRLDLIARDNKGRALTWASRILEAPAPYQLALHADRDSYQVGQTVQFTGTLTDAPELAGAECRLEVRDAAERLVANVQGRIDERSVHFAYPVREALVAPHQATLTVYRGGSPLLAATTEFFVPQFGWDDYENMLWPTTPASQLNETMRDAGGFTAVLDSWGRSSGGQVGARHGFRVARMNDGLLDAGRVQTDPVSGAALYEDVLKRAIAATKRYGALAWVFQDERHRLADAGMPTMEGKRRFRLYLSRQYGDLNALNRSWQSSYKSWDDVDPTLTDAISQGVGDLAPWVDFRRYVADEMFQADQRHAQMVRAALGTHAHIGLDGFMSGRHAVPYAGLDVGRLVTEGVFDFYVPYEDDLLIAALVRGPKAKYLGWSMPRSQYFGAPWRDAFRGFWGSLRFFGPTFWSDFGRLQPAGVWTGDGTRELRQGVGKLLIGSQRQLAPVAILYSYASLVTLSGAQYWSGRGPTSEVWMHAARSRQVLEQSLLDNGVAFGYQTDAQIAAGSLSDTRLLIIPAFMGMALSDETAAAIVRFVQRGGVVLADLAPGVCDEHGKLRQHSALDAVFGIRRSEFKLAQGERDYFVHLARPAALGAPGTDDAWYLESLYEKGLQVSDGEALGAHLPDGTPAFVTKRSGRGQTLLLNSALQPLLPAPNRSLERNHITLMRRVLDLAQVARPASVESDTGEVQTHCEVNRLTDGKNEYLGFYAHHDPSVEPARVQARFQAAKHTYDVRAGTYLGQLDRVPLGLRADEAALFARLDYTLHALRVEVSSAAKRGEPVSVRVSLEASAPAGRHVVHVEVSDPSGAVHRWYTRNVVAPAGSGSFEFIPALNDATGRWRIRAREVISGLTATTDLVIE